MKTACILFLSLFVIAFNSYAEDNKKSKTEAGVSNSPNSSQGNLNANTNREQKDRSKTEGGISNDPHSSQTKLHANTKAPKN